MSAILAVDPGASTGVCVIYGSMVTFHTVKLDTLPRDLATLVKCWPDAAVVCERFVLRSSKARQQSGSSMPAAEAIGVLRGVLQPHREITMLAPGAKVPGLLFAKKYAPDLYDQRSNARNEHERDAFDLAAHKMRCEYLDTQWR